MVCRIFNKDDVATTLARSLPDTCTLYVISKGKVQHIRPTGHHSQHIKVTPTRSIRDTVTLLQNTPLVHPNKNLVDAPTDSEDTHRYAYTYITTTFFILFLVNTVHFSSLLVALWFY